MFDGDPPAQWFYSESGSKFKQAWSAPTGIIELARYDSVSSTKTKLVSFFLAH